MPELLSYDEDAREAVEIVKHHDLGLARARILTQLAEYHSAPWPVDGDELTKRGMK